MTPTPNSEGFWEFIAVIGGNVLRRGGGEHISLIYSVPMPPNVDGEHGYIAFRNTEEPPVQVWASELVRQHQEFNADAILSVAVEAVIELELRTMRRNPPTRRHKQ